MVYINGVRFDEKPGMCCSCPFFSTGSSAMTTYVKGHCRLWDETHKMTINPPARCQKIFNKAFRYPDGSKLVITQD